MVEPRPPGLDHGLAAIVVAARTQQLTERDLQESPLIASSSSPRPARTGQGQTTQFAAIGRGKCPVSRVGAAFAQRPRNSGARFSMKLSSPSWKSFVPKSCIVCRRTWWEWLAKSSVCP